MRADMRNKIAIKQKGQGQNDYGEPVEEWTDFKTDVWASKEHLLGNEFFSALAVRNKVEVKFRTHYFPGVTSEMRVVDSEGEYEIIGPPVNVKNLNRELLLYCKKVK